MNHLIAMASILGVDCPNCKTLKPNLDFVGNTWFLVLISLILGVAFMTGLLAAATGVLRGGFSAIKGREHGLGDMGWSLLVGIGIMVGSVFFGVLIAYAVGLFN